MNVKIDFDKVTKIYRRNRLAIKDLSTRIDAGKISAFIGENGSGKTTSLKCLLGLCFLTGGRILVNGDKNQSFNRSHAQSVGYLPEKVTLPYNVCIREIIMLLGQCRGIGSFDCKQRMNWLAEYFSIDLSRKLKTSQNSNGMTQKVALILALIHEPSLIVLDEPTNALDPVAKSKLFSLLKVKKGEGKTIIIATHHLDELESFADDAFIFDRNIFIAKYGISNMCQAEGFTHVQLLNEATAEVIDRICSASQQIIFRSPENVLIHSDLDLDIAAAINLISGSGLMIKSIVKPKLTLEQSYLEMIKQRAERDGL